MFRRHKAVFVITTLILLCIGLCIGSTSRAQSLFFDNFESYTLGALDKNWTDNPAPNGSGNPWFGPFPPNATLVGPEGSVFPHSGNQMIRGKPNADIDQNWYNLAYRLNNGQPFIGVITLDWWFYDPLGPGGTDFRDYVALAFYDTAPADTDAPANYNLNVGFSRIQRLSLGAPFVNNPAYDPNFYQARVAGATDGFGAGYFNVSTPRSVGWHHAAIVIGPALLDGTNDVSFYIDNMFQPALTHNSVTNYGYNIIEINTSFGLQTGYFDDVNFSFPLRRPIPFHRR